MQRNRTSCVIIAMSLFFAADAFAAGLPVLRPGLWEVVRGTSQQPDKKRSTTMCLDAEFQSQMQDFGMGMAKDMCSQSDRRIEGNRLFVNATCKLGTSTLKSQSVMTFVSDTSYHAETSAVYDPPFMNMSETKGTLDGKWLGACKPGQKPGDITLDNGQTINLRSMMQK